MQPSSDYSSRPVQQAANAPVEDIFVRGNAASAGLSPSAPIRSTNGDSVRKHVYDVADAAPKKGVLYAIGSFLTKSVMGLSLEEVRNKLKWNPIDLSGEGLGRAATLVLGTAIVAVARVVTFGLGLAGGAFAGLIYSIPILFDKEYLDKAFFDGAPAGALIGGGLASWGADLVDIGLGMGPTQKEKDRRDNISMGVAGAGTAIVLSPFVLRHPKYIISTTVDVVKDLIKGNS